AVLVAVAVGDAGVVAAAERDVRPGAAPARAGSTGQRRDVALHLAASAGKPRACVRAAVETDSDRQRGVVADGHRRSGHGGRGRVVGEGEGRGWGGVLVRYAAVFRSGRGGAGAGAPAEGVRVVRAAGRGRDGRRRVRPAGRRSAERGRGARGRARLGVGDGVRELEAAGGRAAVVDGRAALVRAAGNGG